MEVKKNLSLPSIISKIAAALVILTSVAGQQLVSFRSHARVRGLVRQAMAGDRTPSVEQEQERLLPPPPLKCPTEKLTSISGLVVNYSRQETRVYIRIRTSARTTQGFTLKLPKSHPAIDYFLFEGEPFKDVHWKLVEKSQSRLLPNMSATVWICDDGSMPLIDWRPSGLKKK